MRLRHLLKGITPYITTVAMVAGLTACSCSGSDNSKNEKSTTASTEELNTTINAEETTDGEDATADVAGVESNSGMSLIDKLMANKTTGTDDNNSSEQVSKEQETTKIVTGNSGNAGNTGSNTGSSSKPIGSWGNTGSNNKPTNGSSSSNNGTATNNSNSGNSGIGGSGGSGSSGSSAGSGNTTQTTGTAEFVDYVWKTTYEYSTKKVDSNTTNYIATQYDKCYELYADGSEVLLPEYTKIKVYEFMLAIQNKGTYTYVEFKESYDGIDSNILQNQSFKELKAVYDKWYYSDASYNSSTGNNCYYLRNSDNIKFRTWYQLEGDNAAIALVKELGLNDTSVSKEKRLFTLLQWLQDNVPYDYSYSSHNVYDCLVNKKAVCYGYALTICHLLKYTDISALYVEDCETLTHAWNIVQLDDGNWYHIDGGAGTNVYHVSVIEEEISITDLEIDSPYLILRIETIVKPSEIDDYNINTGMLYEYTGTINYANRNNINLNYPVIDTQDSRVYIKGSDLTH